MAKAKKSTKKSSGGARMAGSAEAKEWAEKANSRRYADFAVDDLERIKKKLENFTKSLTSKIDSMKELGLEKLVSVYGATQPERFEREIINFLANIGSAIEKQQRL